MSDNSAGEQIEGNLADLDLDAKFFTLADKDGKIFIKVFWKPPQEERVRKQKIGYYEAPLVMMEENTGGLREAVLIDLPYKPRPDGFPKMQRPGHSGGSGGWKGQPRNEKMILVSVLLKAYTDLWPNCHTPDTVSFADARREIMAAVLSDLPEYLKAGGVV